MDKQQVIDLWKTSFNDSDEFIDLYFTQVYKPENTLVAEKDGRVVAALQMLPYTMTFWGNEIPVAYIAGACTAPQEQNKGLMRELLESAFAEMERRDIPLTVLVPAADWLFDYYRRSGYTEAFDQSARMYTYTGTAIQLPEVIVTPARILELKDYYPYFDKKMKERNCCLQHTFDDFNTIFQDLQLSNGQLLVALDIQRQPVGMAFVLPPYEDHTLIPGEKAIVRELLADTEEIKALLLQEAAIQNNANQVLYYRPPVAGDSHRKGMARIINRNRLTDLFIAANPCNGFTRGELEMMDDTSLLHLLVNYPDRTGYMSLFFE
ncbi:MAG: GNAT family N-acetyltransferase [Tannerellaceae bacterium]|nr:GNAT family N-acetyltransferase [Tannerellaceae bacterium]MCD8264663.1 GNAT family N-acetyltransferase [Tannerellaceae bacterium]